MRFASTSLLSMPLAAMRRMAKETMVVRAAVVALSLQKKSR
jgi:hypothetical protein